MALRPQGLGNYNQVAQNDYSAGTKRYGPSGSNAPTIGPVDNQGYIERDAKAQATRNAMLRRLKAQQRGAFASSDSLSPQSSANAAIPPLNQMLGWYS